MTAANGGRSRRTAELGAWQASFHSVQRLAEPQDGAADGDRAQDRQGGDLASGSRAHALEQDRADDLQVVAQRDEV